MKNLVYLSTKGIDDNIQIQKAIDNLSPTGGTIYLESGQYHFSNDVVINNRSSITLIGSGPGTIINNNDQTSIVIENSNRITIQNISMRVGNIVVLSSSYCVFDNLDVRNTLDAGILLDGQASGASFNVVKNSLFIGNGGVGISQNKVLDSKILNNTMDGNGLEGLTIDNESHRCIVSGNRILNNKGGVGQVGIDYSDLCSITNNIITYETYDDNIINNPNLPALPGITFQNNLGVTNYNVISNNIIIDNPNGGILLNDNSGYGCNSNILNSNIFRSNRVFAIKIAGANSADNIVTSNILGGQPINNSGTNTIIANNR